VANSLSGTFLALIRHGPTAWTNEKRLQGHTNVPLSAEGREMVSRWRLPPALLAYDWVSSPLSRATETARLLGAPALTIEPCLKEMSYGAWEGRRLADLRAELGDRMAENEARGLDFRPDGGESPRELQERLSPWLVAVARDRRPVLAVTHHGVIRALLSLATGWDMTGRPPHKLVWGAAQFFVLGEDGKPIVDRLNVSLEAT
jgi:2,3-bisphosphoglycerate-dependent phosphoglycerate mutase